jgi:dolichol-phosphate mannosyltransferase
MIRYVREKYQVLDEAYAGHMNFFRFLIAGSMGAIVNLSVLYIFTDILGVWYLYSSVSAFIGSFFVSFLLQKFWTFRDHSKDNIHKQASLYFLVLLCGLGLNTLILYFLVEYGGLHYLPGQVMSAAIVAAFSYSAYRHFIFKKQ